MGVLYIICRWVIVVSDDVGHSFMLAAVELGERESRDDLDFLQMNGCVPCGMCGIWVEKNYQKQVPVLCV